MTEIEFNKLKPKIEKLKDDLNNIGLENNEFSILEEIKPDCFNLTESKGNGFLVFYLDERGIKHYESELYNFNDAGEYLKELVKHLQ